MEELGAVKFLDLYRTFSGTSNKVSSLTIEEIKQTICDYCNADWKQILVSFHEHKGTNRYSGLQPVEAIPPESEIIYKFKKRGSNIILYSSGGWYYLEAELGEAKQMGIFLKSRFKQIPYRSWMFAEQFPQVEYRREEIGIVISAGEAGIYNYTCNILTAKITQAFQGSDGIENEGKTIRCKFPKSLLREGKIKAIIVE